MRQQEQEPKRVSERLKSPRTRLFVALELPDAVRRDLARWQGKALADIEDLRSLATDHLHCTLAFLGYRNEKDVGRIAAAAFDGLAGAKPLSLSLGEVKGVPRSRPRLFAIDLCGDSERLQALQAGMCERLAAKRFYKPEKRPFWPHVTVARFKRSRAKKDAGGRVFEGAPPQLWQEQKVPFLGVRLTLYRSVLRQEGAMYESLVQHELGG